MIGDAIRASADRSMWKPHLKKLIAGAHPHTDSKDNPAWNFQYEVYLAAATQLAGYTVTLDEPDVVLKDGDQTVGIAAKRTHSLANLTTNLKKGSQQIEKAGLRGLVALDVSLVAGQNRRLYSDDGAGAIISAQLLVDRFRKDHDAEIKGASTYHGLPSHSQHAGRRSP